MTDQRMSSADVAWLHMDRPENLMIITSVMWLEGPLSLDDLRDLCRRRLLAPYPRFGQRVVESRVGGPRWVDDLDLDLDEHVRRVALPAPAGKAELQALVAELATVPLSRDRPLWRMHLIDNFGAGSAVVVRMHHCIADGIALARVMLSLTDADVDAGIAPPRGGARRGPLRRLAQPVTALTGAARGAAGAAVHEGIEVLRHPTELIDLAAAAEREAEAALHVLVGRPDPPTTISAGRLGVAKRIAWSEGVPLAEVKEIGHAAGASVNDVLLAAVAGGLRTYLRRHDSLVDTITAIVPFNLRPLDEPLPADLGNRFGLVYAPLPVGMRGSLARLREVHRRMDAIKHSDEGAIAYGVLGAIGRAPERVERIAVDLFSARGTAVMTNVPGPREPVSLAGRRVRGVLVWAPTSGRVGMSVSILSYAGKVTVGFLVDAGRVPDPERIVGHFERELAHIGELVGASA